MKNIQNISSFLFKKAQYRLGDGNGNSLLMKIDYENDRYDLIVLEQSSLGMDTLRKEAGKIAIDLLRRKSRVNFAKNNC